MLPFADLVKDDFKAVNQMIIDQLHSNIDMVENIGHYIVEGGGKRLRPLVVLMTARALGYQGRQHIELATIIEFIHTATLLHDDVVDISEMRRNRPTANAKWGNAPSVLVGDFLYSRAFQLMVAVGNMPVMAVMSEATNIIAEGEVLQLVHAGNPETTENDYNNVIHYKTAKLFEAACQLGAIIADSPTDTVESMRQFGYHLGMAFQLIDDVLDYSGSSEELGKNIGDDLAEGKATLPLIYTLQNGVPEQTAVVRKAISEKNNQLLQEVTSAVKDSGALEYTHQRAEQEMNTALKLLETLPETPFLESMRELTLFSVSRSY